jgi:CheY-like chemotaxis protein
VPDSDTSPAATVLVVDDEPNILDLLSAALRMSGFEVHAADSGLAASKLAAAYPPGIVVLDVMLPDLDDRLAARGRNRGGRHLDGEHQSDNQQTAHDRTRGRCRTAGCQVATGDLAD